MWIFPGRSYLVGVQLPFKVHNMCPSPAQTFWSYIFPSHPQKTPQKTPPFLKVNPPKQGPNFNQNKGPHLGSRYIYIYKYINIYIIYIQHLKNIQPLNPLTSIRRNAPVDCSRRNPPSVELLDLNPNPRPFHGRRRSLEAAEPSQDAGDLDGHVVIGSIPYLYEWPWMEGVPTTNNYLHTWDDPLQVGVGKSWSERRGLEAQKASQVGEICFPVALSWGVCVGSVSMSEICPKIGIRMWGKTRIFGMDEFSNWSFFGFDEGNVPFSLEKMFVSRTYRPRIPWEENTYSWRVTS